MNEMYRKFLREAFLKKIYEEMISEEFLKRLIKELEEDRKEENEGR